MDAKVPEAMALQYLRQRRGTRKHHGRHARSRYVLAQHVVAAPLDSAMTCQAGLPRLAGSKVYSCLYE